MWAAFKLFFSNNMAKLIEIGAVILSAIAAILMVYRAGGQGEKTKQLELNLKNSEEANEIRNKNRADLRPGDAAKRLRERW